MPSGRRRSGPRSSRRSRRAAASSPGTAGFAIAPSVSSICRTHRKSLIIDGRVGFTGGAGIADVWLGHAQSPEHWRDTQVRIVGPAVTPLQTGFAQNWSQTTGELLSGATYYPEHACEGDFKVQTVMSSPESGASSVRLMRYLPIVCARRSIYISQSLLHPGSSGDRHACGGEATRRGCADHDLRETQRQLAGAQELGGYGQLLEAGVTVLEYSRTMLHQKTMVVDGLWVCIGTTNFDNRSFAHNEETPASASGTPSSRSPWSRRSAAICEHAIASSSRPGRSEDW